MVFQQVNGVNIRYEVVGAGPPLALIIGYLIQDHQSF